MVSNHPELSTPPAVIQLRGLFKTDLQNNCQVMPEFRQPLDEFRYFLLHVPFMMLSPRLTQVCVLSDRWPTDGRPMQITNHCCVGPRFHGKKRLGTLFRAELICHHAKAAASGERGQHLETRRCVCVCVWYWSSAAKKRNSKANVSRKLGVINAKTKPAKKRRHTNPKPWSNNPLIQI